MTFRAPLPAESPTGGGPAAADAAVAAVHRFIAPKLQGRWLEEVEAARTRGVPPVTTSEPLGGWVDRVTGRRVSNPGTDLAVTLRAMGVSVADLAAYSGTLLEGGAMPRVSVLPLLSVTGPMVDLADVVPHWPVRDTLGWVLAIGGARERARLVLDWVGAGFGAGDFVYPAAGLTPAEARTGVDAGVLTRSGAAVMAGLRGAPLPG